VVYGQQSLRATSVLYEGAPSYPDKHHPWRIIDDNDVTQFYTTPTAIRTFMEWRTDYPAAHDLGSIRLLATVGQRIEPGTWRWFYEHVGNERYPIVDTRYQAETGGITISTLPGACDMKPGSVGPPLPGTDATIVNRTVRRSPGRSRISRSRSPVAGVFPARIDPGPKCPGVLDGVRQSRRGRGILHRRRGSPRQ
jgi:acetyl-CoA synthetase